MDLKTKSKAELIALVEELQSEDANTAIATLQGRVAQLEAEAAQAQSAPSTGNIDAERAEWQSIIDEQQQRIAALEATKGNVLPLVEVDGHRYQIKGNITANGGRVYTPQEIAADADLIKQQVKKGNKMIALVN